LARPDDDTVILEAFKLGTEPTRNSKQMVVRGSTSTDGVKQRPAINTETVGAGTGGLY
jgi:hypothetical protein